MSLYNTSDPLQNGKYEYQYNLSYARFLFFFVYYIINQFIHENISQYDRSQLFIF